MHRFTPIFLLTTLLLALCAALLLLPAQPLPLAPDAPLSVSAPLHHHHHAALVDNGHPAPTSVRSNGSDSSGARRVILRQVVAILTRDIPAFASQTPIQACHHRASTPILPMAAVNPPLLI